MRIKYDKKNILKIFGILVFVDVLLFIIFNYLFENNYNIISQNYSYETEIIDGFTLLTYPTEVLTLMSKRYYNFIGAIIQNINIICIYFFIGKKIYANKDKEQYRCFVKIICFICIPFTILIILNNFISLFYANPVINNLFGFVMIVLEFLFFYGLFYPIQNYKFNPIRVFIYSLKTIKHNLKETFKIILFRFVSILIITLPIVIFDFILKKAFGTSGSIYILLEIAIQVIFIIIVDTIQFYKQYKVVEDNLVIQYKKG